MSSLAASKKISDPQTLVQQLVTLQEEMDQVVFLAQEACLAEKESTLETAEKLQTAFQTLQENFANLATKAKWTSARSTDPLEDQIFNQFRLTRNRLNSVLAKEVESARGICETNDLIEKVFKRYTGSGSLTPLTLLVLRRDITVLYGRDQMNAKQMQRLMDLDRTIAEMQDKMKPQEKEEKKEPSRVQQNEAEAYLLAKSTLIDALNLLAQNVENARGGSSSDQEKKQKIRQLIQDFQPQNVRNEIYEQIWVRAGKPTGDFNYGSNHVVDDLNRLVSIIDDKVAMNLSQ